MLIDNFYFENKNKEKCERKLLSSAMKKQRWCPELSTWDAWNKVSMNDKPKKG